ncbi:MAG: hypothetical protein CMP11_01875, partial [Zetaproteobacteria bacterium]|nr:hypothetical protein [Pseudobdellovibrionaceae bacterium]
MKRLYYLFYIALLNVCFLSCEDNESITEDQKQSDIPSQGEAISELLSKSCQENFDLSLPLISKNYNQSPFHLITEETTIDLVDLGDNCQSLRLEAELGSFDYLHWKACPIENIKNCLEGKIALTSMLIPNVPSDRYNFTFKGCYDDDPIRANSPGIKECLSSLSNKSLDARQNCFCSQTPSEEKFYMPPQNCSEKSREIQENLYQNINSKMLQEVVDFQAMLELYIKKWEGLSLEEKRQNLNFLPKYRVMGNILNTHGSFYLRDLIRLRFKSLESDITQGLEDRESQNSFLLSQEESCFMEKNKDKKEVTPQEDSNDLLIISNDTPLKVLEAKEASERPEILGKREAFKESQKKELKSTLFAIGIASMLFGSFYTIFDYAIMSVPRQQKNINWSDDTGAIMKWQNNLSEFNGVVRTNISLDIRKAAEKFYKQNEELIQKFGFEDFVDNKVFQSIQ